MGTRQADRPVKQIKMKFALLISALVASTFAAPKASNDLTCSICVDVVTDIDEFITEDTTIQQIMDFAKQLCAALGLIIADMETECNKIMEEQLPAIIDNLVNEQLDPQAVCDAIGACP